MKKVTLFFAILLCLSVLLSACDATDPNDLFGATVAPSVSATEPTAPKTDPTVPSAETTTPDKQMPDALQGLTDNPNINYFCGIWMKLTNCTRVGEKGVVPVYSASEDTIQATVTATNGLNREQPYFLMVFADGAPVEFQIEGNTYLSYPLSLTPAHTDLKMEFCPEFSANLGRLDFLLFYDGNPKADHFMGWASCQVLQEGESLPPAKLQATVPQRSILEGSYNGDAYGAWLWNGEGHPSEQDPQGPRDMTVHGGETLWLEAIASKPGLYRTVLIQDGRPLSFTVEGEVYSWLDWESAGTDMLQLPIQLPEDQVNSGSFFTVTIPLSEESLETQPRNSWRILITESREGKE